MDATNDSLVSKLCLGTANFGSSYGVVGSCGGLSPLEVRQVLDCCSAHGIRNFDTAVAYRNSEDFLGHFCAPGMNFVSKVLVSAADDTTLADSLRMTVEGSLERLKIDRLEGMLLHSPAPENSHKTRQTLKELLKLKREGYVRKIGISIYAPSDLVGFSLSELDIVQAPINVFDRRILEEPWVDELTKFEVEIHARSLFLQGLLLCDKRPQYFDRWASKWKAWDSYVRESGVSRISAALYKPLVDKRIHRVIVGVQSVRHLQEVIASIDQLRHIKNVDDTGLWIDDRRLIDPRLWQL